MNFKEQYWKYSLIILLLFMGIIIFREMALFLSGILGAFTIYIMVRNQMTYLTKKKNWGKGLSAAVIIVEVVLIFLIPFSLAIWLLLGELNNINLDPSATIASIQHIGNLIQEKTGYNVLSSENIVKAAGYLPAIGQALLNSVSSFIINAIVMIFVLYFMLLGGKRMEEYLYSLLPFDESNKKDVMNSVNMMVKSNAVGIPLLALIQGVIAMIGYFIFGAPNPILFGFLTCFATIIPILGTSLVWFPLATYLALSGNWFAAIGLAAYALIVISNVDNLVRFIIQKKMADTHPLITVFGVIIGLTLFGFWGVIFGPLLLSIFVLCLNIFKKEYLDKK